MRFRTRTQEVEAIQYTGGNAAEVMALCPKASAHSDGHGREWIQVLDCDNERVMARPGDYILTLDGGWAVTDGGWFESRHEPVPDLIRTVNDYEGLPDGTILWAEDSKIGALVATSVTKVGPWFLLAGIAHGYVAEALVADGYVCSVVRLGGEQ